MPTVTCTDTGKHRFNKKKYIPGTSLIQGASGIFSQDVFMLHMVFITE